MEINDSQRIANKVKPVGHDKIILPLLRSGEKYFDWLKMKTDWLRL